MSISVHEELRVLVDVKDVLQLAEIDTDVWMISGGKQTVEFNLVKVPEGMRAEGGFLYPKADAA